MLQSLTHLDGVLLSSFQYVSGHRTLHMVSHRTEVKNHFTQPTDYTLANPLCGWTSLPPSCSTCSSLGHEVLFLLGCFLSSQSPDCMYGCMELHSPGCRTWHLPQLSFKKFLPGHLFLWPTKIPFCIAAPSSSVLKPPSHTHFFNHTQAF